MKQRVWEEEEWKEEKKKEEKKKKKTIHFTAFCLEGKKGGSTRTLVQPEIWCKGKDKRKTFKQSKGKKAFCPSLFRGGYVY